MEIVRLRLLVAILKAAGERRLAANGLIGGSACRSAPGLPELATAPYCSSAGPKMPRVEARCGELGAGNPGLFRLSKAGGKPLGSGEQVLHRGDVPPTSTGAANTSIVQCSSDIGQR